MSDASARRYAVWPEPRSRSRSIKGSRPSVPHGTNFLCCCVSPGPTQYIFYTPMARYSLYVLKVPLNTTKQTNKHIAQLTQLHGDSNWFQQDVTACATAALYPVYLVDRRRATLLFTAACEFVSDGRALDARRQNAETYRSALLTESVIIPVLSSTHSRPASKTNNCLLRA